MAITFKLSLKVVAMVKYSNVTWAPDVTEESHCIHVRLLLKLHTSFLLSPLRPREKAERNSGFSEAAAPSWPWVD